MGSLADNAPRGGRPAPVHSSFELAAWYFMRMSGVVLLFLAVGHLVIMHLINSIDQIDFQFVARRWANPFWRFYDGLMLILALMHGMNGLRTVAEDYLRPGPRRLLCLSLIYFTAFAALFLGLITVYTFQPTAYLYAR